MFTYIVVDDESLIRKGTIKKLSSISDKVNCIGEASNGKEALELLETLNPDIIITDMNMPVMDGGQFLPHLTEKYPDKHIIVISGYKDFEYTRQAIKANAVDYILKPFRKEDLIASVENAIKLIEDSSSYSNQLVSTKAEKEIARYEYDITMLKNSILGYHTTGVHVTSEKLKFINETHNLVLVTLHSITALKEETLQNFLTENGFGDLALYLQHTHNQNLGFMILFIPQRSALGTKDLCTQVVRSLNSFFASISITVSYGISASHPSLSELNTAFLETVKALNHMHVTDQGNYYFFTEAETNSNIVINWGRPEELMFRIEAGMIVQIRELLDELFIYFTTLSNCSLYDTKNYCFYLADKTKLLMTRYFDQVDPNSVNSSVQNILNFMFSLEEIKQYYIQFFTNISTILAEKSIYATDNTIEKIKTYVMRNYQNNLTIEFVSSLFYMNRSYCSHLFKEKTGDNFVNFLNTVRLDKAKQLLKDTDKKLYYISKAVGYDNVKYFFRVFKKYEKITPEQYRCKCKVNEV
jgi:two-component system response regulator YesN